MPAFYKCQLIWKHGPNSLLKTTSQKQGKLHDCIMGGSHMLEIDHQIYVHQLEIIPSCLASASMLNILLLIVRQYF